MKKHYFKFAEEFPEWHRREGKLTHFANLIKWDIKTHTIRNDYLKYKSIVDEVNAGKAVAILVTVSGTEIARYTKLGIQKLAIKHHLFIIDDVPRDDMPQVWLNDGLNYVDFASFFKLDERGGCYQNLAIIHFNNFKY